jgi:hypothetical protein
MLRTIQIAASSVTGAPVTASSASSATTAAALASVTAATHSEPNASRRAATGFEAALSTRSASLANFITVAMTSFSVVRWSSAATTVASWEDNVGSASVIGGAGGATVGASGAIHVAFPGENASMS